MFQKFAYDHIWYIILTIQLWIRNLILIFDIKNNQVYVYILSTNYIIMTKLTIIKNEHVYYICARECVSAHVRKILPENCICQQQLTQCTLFKL